MLVYGGCSQGNILNELWTFQFGNPSTCIYLITHNFLFIKTKLSHFPGMAMLSAKLLLYASAGFWGFVHNGS